MRRRASEITCLGYDTAGVIPLEPFFWFDFTSCFPIAAVLFIREELS